MYKMIKIESVSPSKMAKIENSSDDEDDENLTYEQLREKRIKENMEVLDLLGVNEAAENLSNSINKKPLIKSTALKRKSDVNVTQPPVRRSMRIAKVPLPTDENEENHDDLEKADEKSSNKSDVVDQDSIQISNEDSFFEKLGADLAIKEAVNDFHTCDFDRFTQVLKSLEMYEFPIKVANSRIYSLAIHPLETSLIVATGDMKGNIVLYNKNESDMRECRIHDAPVNCVSFCTWDSHKLFSTSHDGSVRCGDIVKRTFDIIYSKHLWDGSDRTNFRNTWHCEYERNLLIGNGSGRVHLIDTRIPNKINSTVWCHERSVRTVHCHPKEKHHFLTSSGIGEVSLWDIRKMTDKTINPVLQFEHSKSLTSAFFSATGKHMISTSNDNYIRIFDTKKLNIEATKPVKKIEHNNHTGRWLSVFKAKFNPGRDDAFFVGSMQVPKRIQIYRSDGKLLHHLIAEDMTTFCPVIEVHPTQAIYVGGNSSGRLHIFSTKEQLPT